MPYKNYQDTLDRVKQYAKDHPDIAKKCQRNYEISGRKWAANIMRVFKMSVEQYHRLEAEQNGGCAICGRAQVELGTRTRRLAIDHNRACCSGEKSCGRCWRGLLCSECNPAIGALHDSPERLRKAAEYLERYQK